MSALIARRELKAIEQKYPGGKIVARNGRRIYTSEDALASIGLANSRRALIESRIDDMDRDAREARALRRKRIALLIVVRKEINRLVALVKKIGEEMGWSTGGLQKLPPIPSRLTRARRPKSSA
jgi:hypothetical protein